MTERRLLRDLPSIDRLLGDAAVLPLLSSFPRPAVLAALRAACDGVRQMLLENRAEAPDSSDALALAVIEGAQDLLRRRFNRALKRVVNATGVVLHTNLGRALLCEEAIEAVSRAARAYTDLELDLGSGRRGRRAAALHDLLCELSGAEDACVVNNNAASVLLILDSLARGREVVVSRSELIEIGGSFRLPEVLERSGAVLREVGATNKTYPRDYERAISDRTGLLLKSHQSNYRMVGFVREVTLAELVEVARAHAVPAAMDLGSGVLVDLARWNLPHEPTVRECVEAGIDVVCFSGDKLLGGPQAGIIVGKRDVVRRCASNPLMRALRCDKLTLAALEATLSLYRYEDRLPESVPVLRMLAAPLSMLETEARALGGRLQSTLGEHAEVEARPGASLAGGGSLPAHELPTWLVSVVPRHENEAVWAERLRRATPPIMVRVDDGRLLLDPRTLQPGDLDDLVAAFAQLLSPLLQETPRAESRSPGSA